MCIEEHLVLSESMRSWQRGVSVDVGCDRKGGGRGRAEGGTGRRRGGGWKKRARSMVQEVQVPVGRWRYRGK